MDFLELCEKVEQIVKVNWQGVHVYLKPVYKYYFGLFQKLILPMVQKVWTENNLPELGVSPSVHPSWWQSALCEPQARLEMDLIIYFDLITRNDA